MDGANEMEIFVKELWTCSGATLQPTQHHELNYGFQYSPNTITAHTYLAYNGFGFQYSRNYYVFSDWYGTTIKYGDYSNYGYLKVNSTGVHIRKAFHTANLTRNLMYEYGIYYSTEYHEQNDIMTICINRGSAETQGEEWKHLNFTGHSMVFQTNNVGTYRYFVGGQYHEQTISTESYTDLFTIPANSETSCTWMGNGWLIYCKSLG